MTCRPYTAPILALLTTLLLSSCQIGTLPEKSSPSHELRIPYQKHVLDNGLTVILHEDHSDPVVHVDVTYHVGSAREALGKSGFAHLFEHMMFQGSENVADEEHIKRVTEAGGTMNGTTNRDRTNYFETVPANHLETMLWLEADRMGFFLEGITQEKFEIQRATVKNEKQQNYDNRPYGRAFELIAKTLYPETHPYSWLTIGDLEDLDNATAEDLRHFFLQWYGPNNATLTIGGDIQPDNVLRLVKKYFGGIARGPDIPPLQADAFKLEDDRYISYHDANIRFPAVTMSFPTVPRFHPDAPALQCLADILGHGKGSYLYQNLVATQKAIQASASQNSDELAGEFFMFVLPYPGKSLSAFEKELRDTLVNFEKNGVSDDDLLKYKARYESGFIHGLEKVSGKVAKLAYYETFANDPGYINTELEQHLSLTKEDVMRAYERHIKNKPGVVLSILSKPEEKPARADNISLTKQSTATTGSPQTELVYKKTKDTFDRSIQPQAGAAKLVQPPEFWTDTLAPNIKIIGATNSELPTITFTLYLQGGYLLDSIEAGRQGLAALSAEMLNTATKRHSEKAISEELEKLGSQIYISANSQRFEISVTTLSKHYRETLAILKEKLFEPAFNETDFRRVQTQAIESALSSTQSPAAIASSVFDTLLYGDDHIFGLSEKRMAASMQTLRVSDAEDFYQRNFSVNGAEIVVVGDIDQTEFVSSLHFLSAFNAAPLPAVTLPPTPEYAHAQLFFVNKADAAQTEIRIGYLSNLRFDATGEFFKRQLMNFTLGGAFNSRINLNLREDKGVTYGARSWFESSEIPGPFTVSTSVKKQASALAVSEILKEIHRFRDDTIDHDELRFLKRAIGQSDALKYESNRQKESFLAQILRYDIDPNFVERQKSLVHAIRAEDIQNLARQHLPVDRMIILVVGDKPAIYNELNTLNTQLGMPPIIELNAEGQSLTQTR